jgi:hypothetical protein
MEEVVGAWKYYGPQLTTTKKKQNTMNKHDIDSID